MSRRNKQNYKLFGQNKAVVNGQLVDLVNGRVPTPIDPIELERQAETARQADEARERQRSEKASRVLSQTSFDFKAEPCPDNVRGSVSEIRSRIEDTIAEAQTVLERESGITLSQYGYDKLRQFSRLNLGYNWLSKDVWLAAFDYLQNLGVLVQDRDIFVGQPTAPQPEPEPENLDDILRNESTSTRDGERRIKTAVVDAFMGYGRLPMWSAWLTSLATHFGVSPSSEIQQEAWTYCQRMNLSPHDPKTYDTLRRWLVASGRLNESCLSTREVIEGWYRDNSIDDREYMRLLRGYETVLDLPRATAGI